MTIATETRRNDYAGNGATSSYSFTFKIYSEDDLLVIQRDDSTDAETVLVIDVNYSVTFVAGDPDGGSITLLDGNLASGQSLVIKGNADVIQETDIKNQGSFYPEAHEKQFDKCVIIDQQQQEAIDRSVKMADSEDPSDFDTRLPAGISSSAGKVLAVNADGDGFELISASGVVDTTKVAKAGDTMTGNLVMAAQKEVRFADLDSSNYIGMKAPAVQASDQTYTLPAFPSATKYLQSTNAGVMSFATANEIDATATKTMSGSTATAGNVAISSSSGSFSSSSTTFVDVTNLSVTLTTVGRPVHLMLIDDGSGTAAGIQCNDGGSSSAQSFFQFVRGSTNLTNSKLELGSTGSTAVNSFAPPAVLQHMDIPAAGTYTYKLQARMVAGDSNVQVQNCKLIAYELR